MDDEDELISRIADAIGAADNAISACSVGTYRRILAYAAIKAVLAECSGDFESEIHAWKAKLALTISEKSQYAVPSGNGVDSHP